MFCKRPKLFLLLILFIFLVLMAVSPPSSRCADEKYIVEWEQKPYKTMMNDIDVFSGNILVSKNSAAMGQVFGGILAFDEKGEKNGALPLASYVTAIKVNKENEIFIGHTLDTDGFGIIKYADNGWKKEFQKGENYAERRLYNFCFLEDDLIGVGKSGSGLWLVRLDKKGELVYEKKLEEYEKIDCYFAHSVQPTPDNNLIVVGNNGDINETWILKMNPQGDVLWGRNLGPIVTQKNSLLRTLDNHYILVGHKDFKAWALKFDPDGKKIWETTFDDAGRSQFNAIVQMKKDAFIAGGFKKVEQNDIIGKSSWIVRIDNNGKKVWDRILKRKDQDAVNEISAMTKLSENRLGITGWENWMSGFKYEKDRKGWVIQVKLND